jgi:hypothetical protein
VESIIEKRKEIVWRMQEILYDQSPYIVLVYPKTLESYDTARWQGWVKSPGETGSVHNNWSFLAFEPVGVVESAGGTGWLWPVVIIAVIAAAGLVVWLILRSRGKAVEEQA